VSDLTDKQVNEKINRAIKKFHGDSRELAAAIGIIWIGRQVGWRAIILMHDKKTIKKYQGYLDLDYRDVMPPMGPLADRSVAWVAVKKVSNFWKAVKGEISGVRSPDLS
jgi:hypothetical protein